MGWASLAAVAALVTIIFFDGLAELVHIWSGREEYSHGFLIPVISAFLIWQQKDKLQHIPFAGSWLGIVVVLLGIALFFLGELSTLYIIVQYSLLVVLAGVGLSLVGLRGLPLLVVPLVFLAFMVPLPPFLYNNLSAKLQLISSELGVAVIRLFGISVFLEGNVIDLGTYKLQVVEACNGLRYLFPLMSFAFLCAYLFKQQMWKRIVIFLSSIPITILMNSFRIGVIGVLVEHWGTGAAEGFLHDFEGWAVFMGCVAILMGEMWLLARIGGGGRAFRDVFAVHFPEPPPQDATVRVRPIPVPYLVSGAVLVLAAVASSVLSERAESIPARAEFTAFPVKLGEWQGRRDRLEDIYLNALKLTDYVITDYSNGEGEWVNFYVAYYSSQRKGESAHSPRSCLPGGGWEIRDLSRHAVEGATAAGKPLVVNRVRIQKGEHKQLVYYWFQQRGRVIDNEYLVKWYLFWDALTRNRTDGALVRLTTLIKPAEDWATGDARLADFAQAISGRLEAYIPD